MKKEEVDNVSIKDFKASIFPLMITLFFYWIALSMYVVYLYFTNGILGIPFYLLTSGTIIYGVCSLIYRRKMK